MFDGFNYASVSEFTDKKINLLSKSNGNMLLSEQKIRAVVTNAKQMHKVREPCMLLFQLFDAINQNTLFNSFFKRIVCSAFI
jgi:3-methyladenine DNA glycosylase Tag